MTPQEYRAKWRLSNNYPMVAPAYREQRSQLAKTAGLGQKPDAVVTKDQGEVSAKKRW